MLNGSIIESMNVSHVNAWERKKLKLVIDLTTKVLNLILLSRVINA